MNRDLLRWPMHQPGRHLATSLLGHAGSRLTRGLSVVAALTAATLCGAALWHARVATGAAGDAEFELERQRVLRISRAEMPRDRSAGLPPPQVASWLGLARQLNTDWPALFTLLETRTPTDVALLEVEPDARRRTVRLTAESPRLDRLLDLAEALRGDPLIEDVILQRHETREQDPSAPVRLTLELRLGAAIASARVDQPTSTGARP